MSKYDPALLEKAVRTIRQADSNSHGVETLFDSLDRAPWWEKVESPRDLIGKNCPVRAEWSDGSASEYIDFGKSRESIEPDVTYFRDTRPTPPVPPPLAVGEVIETVEDLGRLPVGAILPDKDGDAWQRPAGLVLKCVYPTVSGRAKDVVRHGPFTVRWLPEAEATE